MQNNQPITTKLLRFAMIIGVVTTVYSCMGNGNTTDAKDRDSTRMTDNTMTTTPGANDPNTMTNDSSNNSVNNTAVDAAFMLKVAEINMEEIKLGKLAQQKGTTSHVKALGKMMVAEHEQAMNGLTTLAKTKMVTLPTSESQQMVDTYKMLSEKKGKDFDKAYSDMMVNGHKEAIALFEKTNSDTKDADVKAMTIAMIPKLKTHLEHAEMCKKECEKM